MGARDRRRAAFVVGLLVAAALVTNGVVGYGGTTLAAADREADRPLAERHPVVDPTDGVTVVAARGFDDHDASAALVAFAPDGRPLYHDASLDAYRDVEPTGGSTVVYVGRTTRDGRTVNVVERVDLATGAVERLHAGTDGDWRALARADGSGLLVVDAENRRAFRLDVDTGRVTREWSAGSAVAAEVRAEWRPDAGRADLAYGPDVDYRHPSDADYLPTEAGGPAVLAADAGDERLVEYQRRGGSWERTWQWQTPRLEAPSDVERLEGGRTLVANTGGNEVFEITPDGEVDWSAAVVRPHDVERVPAGGHGPSAARADLQSTAVADRPWHRPVGQHVHTGLEWLGLGPALDLLPYWVLAGDLPALALLVGIAGAWLLSEWRWARRSPDRPEPAPESD